jgi:hypothetical protein
LPARVIVLRRIGQDRPRRLTQSGCNKEHLFVDHEALRSCNARLEEEDGPNIFHHACMMGLGPAPALRPEKIARAGAMN